MLSASKCIAYLVTYAVAVGAVASETVSRQHSYKVERTNLFNGLHRLEAKLGTNKMPAGVILLNAVQKDLVNLETKQLRETTVLNSTVTDLHSFKGEVKASAAQRVKIVDRLEKEIVSFAAQEAKETGLMKKAQSELSNNLERMTAEQRKDRVEVQSLKDEVKKLAEFKAIPGPVGPRGERGEKGEYGKTGPQGDEGRPGIPGHVGPVGARGVRGDQGEPGEKGEKGDAGEGLKLRPFNLGRSYNPGDYVFAKATDGTHDSMFIAQRAFAAKRKPEYDIESGNWVEFRAPEGPRGSKGTKGDPGLNGVPGKDGKDGQHGQHGEPGKDGHDGSPGLPGKDGRDGAHGMHGERGVPGPQGVQGVKGTDGIDGAKGERGERGINGRDGRDGTDGIDGKPGSQGVKGIKGDRGPKGEDGRDGRDGQRGPTGNQGIHGIMGLRGEKGLPGKAGPEGSDGPAGPRGVQGRQGLRGATGLQGPRGIQGEKGTDGLGLTLKAFHIGSTYVTGDYVFAKSSSHVHDSIYIAETAFTATKEPEDDSIHWVEFQAPKGDPGEKGSTGNAGRDGKDGKDGTDGQRGQHGEPGATGLQGPRGFTGSTGSAGTNGRDGDPGKDGQRGHTGATGVGGINGINGENGSRGRPGATGPPGIIGATGDDGPRGATGSRGETGSEGKRGEKGPKGDDGIGLSLKMFKIGNVYAAGDYVFHQHTMYVAQELFTAKADPGGDKKHWAAFHAPRGERGATGATGATGVNGDHVSVPPNFSAQRLLQQVVSPPSLQNALIPQISKPATCAPNDPEKIKKCEGVISMEDCQSDPDCDWFGSSEQGRKKSCKYSCPAPLSTENSKFKAHKIMRDLKILKLAQTRSVSEAAEKLHQAKIARDKSYVHTAIAKYEDIQHHLTRTRKELLKLENSFAAMDAAYNAYKSAEENIERLKTLGSNPESIAAAEKNYQHLKIEYEQRQQILDIVEKEAGAYEANPHTRSFESKTELQAAKLSFTVLVKNDAEKVAELTKQGESPGALSKAKKAYFDDKEKLIGINRKLEALFQ